MTPLVIGYIGIAALIILLFSGIHIAVTMGLIGFLGIVYLTDWEAAFSVLGAVPYSAFGNYDLSVAPLFILMGSFCFYAGLSKDLFDTVHKWLGHFRGGLAMATVGACAGFAAVSGSSLATAATMGTVALPEMKRYKYDPQLATGAVAAGGTIGILIPPSVILIIYAILTEQSVGKLFLAGFIPGVLEAVFYIGVIFIICRMRPEMGPPGPKTNFIDKIKALKGTWIVILLFLTVIGGLYFGIFSPTEAAGVGAGGAFIFALARRRLNWQNFKGSLYATTKTTAMIFAILLGAMIFGYFLAITRLPFALADFIGGLPVNRYIIIIFILVLYLFLGCVMDAMGMILLTVPILFPVVHSLGFDAIWFGIIIVRVFEMASITPPVGLNVFVIKGVAKDVPMSVIFRGIIPFLMADLVHVAFLIAVPQVTLFLPNLMMH
jgi:tripartite ATP-independent transporter DctM subunit